MGMRHDQTAWQWHSLAVGHGTICDQSWQKNGQCHSQTVGHGMRCDVIAWKKRGSVTHKLLV
jgi:hypothetical protein